MIFGNKYAQNKSAFYFLPLHLYSADKGYVPKALRQVVPKVAFGGILIPYFVI